MEKANYYILTTEVENDDHDAILEGYNNKYLRRIKTSFSEGINLPIDDILEVIEYQIAEYSLRGTMTDHLSVDEIDGLVFSENIKQLFQKNNISNIEYIQLHLIDEYDDDEEIREKGYTNYFIANIVGLIDCVDHEESDLEYFYPLELRKLEKENNNIINPFSNENPNDIDFIITLVLDESKIGQDQKIFRLLDNPDLLVFHKSIVQAIRKAKLTGFVFIPIEEYTDEIPDDDDDEIKETQKEKEPSPEEIEAEKKAQLKQERREAVAAIKARVKKRIEAGEGPTLI